MWPQRVSADFLYANTIFNTGLLLMESVKQNNQTNKKQQPKYISFSDLKKS